MADGFPTAARPDVILVLTRIVLVLCVFLVVERACRSSRAGGIGVPVYAAGPEFYALGAQYGYETLALAFAVAAVYLLFVSIDAAQPKRGKLFALALISIAGMVVSHHVTAWLTTGFLVVWAAGLRFIIDPSRRRVTLHQQARYMQPRTWRVHKQGLRLVTSNARGGRSSRGSLALLLWSALFWQGRGSCFSAISLPDMSARSFEAGSSGATAMPGDSKEIGSSSRTPQESERRSGKKGSS